MKSPQNGAALSLFLLLFSFPSHPSHNVVSYTSSSFPGLDARDEPARSPQRPRITERHLRLASPRGPQPSTDWPKNPQTMHWTGPLTSCSPLCSSTSRVSAIASQLDPSSQGRKALLAKNDNDVVICAAVRTPFTRAKKGGFKDTCPEDLLVAVFKAVVARSGVDPALVEEIQVGNVLPPGGGASVARMAQLAGTPSSSPPLSAASAPPTDESRPLPLPLLWDHSWIP